jgi:hypothetical protein
MPPIQGDMSKPKGSLLNHHSNDASPVLQDLRDSPLSGLGGAAEYFGRIPTAQRWRNLSPSFSIVMLALRNIRRSISNAWSGLCEYANENYLELVAIVIVT